MSSAIQAGTFKELIFWSSDKQPFALDDLLQFTYVNGVTTSIYFKYAIIGSFFLTDGVHSYQENLNEPTLIQITHVATGRIFRRDAESVPQ